MFNEKNSFHTTINNKNPKTMIFKATKHNNHFIVHDIDSVMVSGTTTFRSHSDLIPCNIYGEKLLEPLQFTIEKVKTMKNTYYINSNREDLQLNKYGELSHMDLSNMHEFHFYDYDTAANQIKISQKNNQLTYNNDDIGIVYAKQDWISENKELYFSWNEKHQHYAYCKLENGKIIFKPNQKHTKYRNLDKSYSMVGQEVLDSPMWIINPNMKTIGLEKSNNNNLYTCTGTTTINNTVTDNGLINAQAIETSISTFKGETMNEKLTKENILKVLCEGTSAEPETPKTDLEKREQYVVHIYDGEGRVVTKTTRPSKKKAKKILQDPENIGKTIVIYKEESVVTTNIPLVETKS